MNYSLYEPLPNMKAVMSFIDFDGSTQWRYEEYTAKEVYQIANSEARAARFGLIGRENMPQCMPTPSYADIGSIKHYIAYHYNIDPDGKFARVMEAAISLVPEVA